MHPDTVLYLKAGRAAPQPILSLSPDDPDVEVKVAAVKQHHTERALKAGAPLPEFDLVEGSGRKPPKKEKV